MNNCVQPEPAWGIVYGEELPLESVHAIVFGEYTWDGQDKQSGIQSIRTIMDFKHAIKMKKEPFSQAIFYYAS